jgi:ankyrin repeat protein
MKTLLAAVTILFSISCFSQNLMMKAITDNNLAKVKSLVEEKPDTINKEMEYLSYPVVEAAGMARLDIVKYLVEKGAKLDAKTAATGETAILKMASAMGSPNDARKKDYLATLDYLAGQKLSFSVTDKEGKGPLKILAKKNIRTADVKNYMEIVNAFIKYGAKLTDRGNACSLHELLDSPGIPGGDKKTDFGSFEAAKELVGIGANVNEPDESKNTPLHVVLLNKKATDDLKVDIVKFLMEKGAKATTKNGDKKSPEDLVKKESPLYDIIKKTKPKK